VRFGRLQNNRRIASGKGGTPIVIYHYKAALSISNLKNRN